METAEGVPWYIQRAKGYLALIEKIMAFLGGILNERGYVSRQENQATQEMMRDLKARFAEDVKFARSDRRLERLSQEEQEFYWVVRKASAYLNVKLRMNPVTSNWHGELYNCRIDFNYYLRGLEGRECKAANETGG